MAARVTTISVLHVETRVRIPAGPRIFFDPAACIFFFSLLAGRLVTVTALLVLI